MKIKGSLAVLSATMLLALSWNSVHADSVRQSKIKQLEGERTELETKNAKSGYSSDGRWYSLTEAENRIKELEKQIADLKVPYYEKNKIQVSSAYVKALNNFTNYSNSDSVREEAERVLKRESETLSLQKNNFISAASDQVEVYDINNLPKEVVVELNYFALDMLNQVRKQFGSPSITLAQSSMDFSDKLSQKVRNANRSVFDWHYVKGINEVASEYGLPTSSKEEENSAYGIQYYENYYATTGLSSESTKAEMKREIYNAILEFLFNGQEFSHAQSISGVNQDKSIKDNYFGLSVHYLKDGAGISFINVDNTDLSKSKKNNFNVSSPSNQTENNRKKLLSLKESLVKGEKTNYEKLNNSYNDYVKLIKEIDRLSKLEEKEKLEKEKLEKEKKEKQNKQNVSPSKPVQNGDKPKQTKPSQNQSKTSTVKAGWLKENGSWFYYRDGKQVKSTWQGSYYLKSDGKMAEKEWVYDSYYGSWFYLNEGGSYVNNQWFEVDGVWYYFKLWGYMESNAWQGSYYLKSDGKMAEKEWVYDSYYGSWFYLNEDGTYVNNQWLEVDGVWYYFKLWGYMESNAWQGSYYLKSSGAMAVNEWIYDSYYRSWYYLKSDGSYARNEWVQGWYYVDYSGKWI
ncbi:SEC10/PgrA surface exclusion domain-containing protein [Falseniella ignava]